MLTNLSSSMSCDCYGFLKLARSSKSYRCRKSLYFIWSSGTLQPCLPSTNKGVIQTTVTAAWMVFCDRMCKPTICLMFGYNQNKTQKKTHVVRCDQSFQRCPNGGDASWCSADHPVNSWPDDDSIQLIRSNNGTQTNASTFYHGWANPKPLAQRSDPRDVS